MERTFVARHAGTRPVGFIKKSLLAFAVAAGLLTAGPQLDSASATTVGYDVASDLHIHSSDLQTNRFVVVPCFGPDNDIDTCVWDLAGGSLTAQGTTGLFDCYKTTETSWNGTSNVSGVSHIRCPGRPQALDIDAGAANDQIQVGSSLSNTATWSAVGPNEIRGGQGDDTINTYPDAGDTVWGGPGNDTINTRGGHDQIYGGAGYYGDFRGSGNDTIAAGSDVDYVWGEDGEDDIKGGSESDELRGGDGRDAINGESGHDKIWGENDDDNRTARDGGSTGLTGGTGEDRIFGDDGRDRIDGGEGNDPELRGGSNDDYLYGGTGNDDMGGESGVDRMWGDDNEDTLYGDDDTDYLYGGRNVDHLYGGDDGSRDILKGGDDNDEAWGGSGNDDLDGGPGDDTLRGEDGTDTADYSDSVFAVVVSLAIAGRQNTFGSNFDDLEGIENLIGTSESDTLTGNASRNEIYGRRGGDRIRGGGEVDRLRGEQGGDTINGDAGDDYLYGGDEYGDDGLIDTLRGDADNDHAWGGGGHDTLEGGTGSDELWGEAGNDSVKGDDGDDTLEGGLDQDYINGGYGNDKIWGRDGADDINGCDPILCTDTTKEDNDEIKGGNHDDSIEGDQGNDKIWGEDSEAGAVTVAGNETRIWGGAGEDVIYAGPGNEGLAPTGKPILNGGPEPSNAPADDKVFGEAGQDAIASSQGRDELHGGLNGDILVKSDGDLAGDAFYGDEGNDNLDTFDMDCGQTPKSKAARIPKGTKSCKGTSPNFGATPDNLDCGTGKDSWTADHLDSVRRGDVGGCEQATFTTAYFSSPALDIDGGAPAIGGSETINSDIEFSRATNGGVRITERAGYFIYTPPGGGCVYEDSAHTIVRCPMSYVMTTRLGEGDDKTIESATFGNVAGLVKYAFGDNGDDRLRGGAGLDIFSGGNGSDFLYGGAGTDILNGDGGDDSGRVGVFDAYVDGGSGVDFVLGGMDDDDVRGGEQQDFVFGDNFGETSHREGNDQLYDYKPGYQDVDGDFLFGEGGADWLHADGRAVGGIALAGDVLNCGAPNSPDTEHDTGTEPEQEDWADFDIYDAVWAVDCENIAEPPPPPYVSPTPTDADL